MIQSTWVVLFAAAGFLAGVATGTALTLWLTTRTGRSTSKKSAAAPGLSATQEQRIGASLTALYDQFSGLTTGRRAGQKEKPGPEL